jgi:hypothetical protein
MKIEKSFLNIQENPVFEKIIPVSQSPLENLYKRFKKVRPYLGYVQIYPLIGFDEIPIYKYNPSNQNLEETGYKLKKGEIILVGDIYEYGFGRGQRRLYELPYDPQFRGLPGLKNFTGYIEIVHTKEIAYAIPSLSSFSELGIYKAKDTLEIKQFPQKDSPILKKLTKDQEFVCEGRIFFNPTENKNYFVVVTSDGSIVGFIEKEEIKNKAIATTKSPFGSIVAIATVTSLIRLALPILGAIYLYKLIFKRRKG